MPQPTDTTDSSDATHLLRRIKPIADCVVLDGDAVRPTSIVFRDGRGELSVSLDVPGKLEDFKIRYPDAGVVSFSMKSIIDMGYEVVPDPVPEDPHHHVIRIPNQPGQECLRQKDASKFARSKKYVWQHQPPNLLELARAKINSPPA